jgi:hypothetical protein
MVLMLLDLRQKCRPTTGVHAERIFRLEPGPRGPYFRNYTQRANVRGLLECMWWVFSVIVVSCH